jgi:hypothetical protein
MALRFLASALSSPGMDYAKSALLCCQAFISIEQVRANYAALAQHIIQGLGIMREHRARPVLTAEHELLPARHGQLPLLDVFIIKLFGAPCKFAERPATFDTSATTVAVQPPWLHRQFSASRNLRSIAPEMRTQLTKIVTSTLAFLDKVSHFGTVGDATQLLPEKASLPASLQSWLIELELNQVQVRPRYSGFLSLPFMRLLHRTLNIILQGVLELSQDLATSPRIGINCLRILASSIEEKVKNWIFMR